MLGGKKLAGAGKIHFQTAPFNAFPSPPWQPKRWLNFAINENMTSLCLWIFQQPHHFVLAPKKRTAVRKMCLYFSAAIGLRIGLNSRLVFRFRRPSGFSIIFPFKIPEKSDTGSTLNSDFFCIRRPIMNIEIGQLSPVELKRVWNHEALDFTPWMANNISLLGQTLGWKTIRSS